MHKKKYYLKQSFGTNFYLKLWLKIFQIQKLLRIINDNLLELLNN